MSGRLQVHLSAKDLVAPRSFRGLSPFAILTVRGTSPEGEFYIAGQTNVVFNNQNPVWSETIYVDGYKMSLPLWIEVGVFDFEASGASRTKDQLSRMDNETQRDIIAQDIRNSDKEIFPHRVLGTALFECGELLTKRGSTAGKGLQSGGSVVVHLERSSGDTGSLQLELKALKLTNARSLMGKSCPFFELFRRVERPNGATWISVYRSPVVKSSLSPEWKPITLSVDLICNGDLETPIKVTVWDHRKNGRHKLMGEIEMSVQGLVRAHKDLYDTDTGLSLNKHGVDTGTLLVVEAQLDEGCASSSSQAGRDHSRKPDYVEYLQGGCQISLAVAIDFTASNGDPRQAGTPHYFHTAGDGNDFNDYEKAIYAVGSILAKYDSNQSFPVWGFGAKYDGELRNCFQCGQDVEVDGIRGILEAYRGVFRTELVMASPTDITEVVDTAAAYARHEQEAAEGEGEGCLAYTILLILTAGNVENLEETKDILNAVSGDPISVIIVGIGDADFGGMSFLDDHDPSREEGRDITKFVRFNDYKGYNALTEAVLDEVPGQLVDYYYDKGIYPGNHRAFPACGDVPLEDADDDERTITFLG